MVWFGRAWRQAHWQLSTCSSPACCPTRLGAPQAEFKSAASDFGKHGQDYDAARLREQVRALLTLLARAAIFFEA